jgi:hypothetical protein
MRLYASTAYARNISASALRSVFPPPVGHTRVDGGIAQNRQGRPYGCLLVRAEQDRFAWRALCGDNVSHHSLALLALLAILALSILSRRTHARHGIRTRCAWGGHESLLAVRETHTPP